MLEGKHMPMDITDTPPSSLHPYPWPGVLGPKKDYMRSTVTIDQPEVDSSTVPAVQGDRNVNRGSK